MKRYVIIAGETSGDMYGSKLMKLVKENHNEAVSFWGVGGEKMCEEGLFPLEEMNNISVVGFTEIIKKIPTIVKLLNRLSFFTHEMKPDGIILIDFPGFNMKLAKKIKKKSNLLCPIIYFVSPQLWAWNEGRVKIIKKFIDKMLVIFPFEEVFYKKHKVNATYTGHPFVDDWVPENKIELKNILGFNEKNNVISIFPGSRRGELKKHLPIYIKAIDRLKAENPTYQFALGLAPGFNKNVIRHKYKLNNISIITERPLKLLECSDVAIVTSGTISLQSTLIGTPCVINYRLSFISWILSKILIKVKYISMTNIMANKMILPELVQYDVTPKNIVKEVNKILNDLEYNRHIKKELTYIKSVFYKKKKSIYNAAQIITKICDEKN